MRGLGSILTGGNILSLDFFHVVKPPMPILALFPISSSLWKTRVSAVRHTAGIQRQLTRTHPKYHPRFTARGGRIKSIVSPELSRISHLRHLSYYINELESVNYSWGLHRLVPTSVCVKHYESTSPEVYPEIVDGQIFVTIRVYG